MIMSRSCAQPARTRVFSIAADARPSAVNNNYDGRFVLHRPPLSFSHVTLSRRYRVFRGRFAASARPPLTKLQRRANGSRGVQSTLSFSLPAFLSLSLFLSGSCGGFSTLLVAFVSRPLGINIRQPSENAPFVLLSRALVLPVFRRCFPTSRRIPRLYGYIPLHTDF